MMSTMVRKQRRGSDAVANKSVFLPMELIITQILPHLSVKSILRFKCVTKLWNNLTSDSYFVHKHLKFSSRNPHITFSWRQNSTKHVLPIPVHRLLKDASAIVSADDLYLYRVKNPSWLVGSCNGLLCFQCWKSYALALFGYNPFQDAEPFKYLFHTYNPATRIRSQIFEFTFGIDFKFAFGYDASTTTYKIVAFRAKVNCSEVKVFNLCDKNNCWRNIQEFPMVPPNRLDLLDHFYTFPKFDGGGVHFCGTINWLAWDKSITIVIVSLDLSTETYKQFRLPPLGYYDHYLQISQPILRVLMDSLFFSHEDSNKTEFILWKMKEYGVEESWTQLFKINYQNLAMQGLHYELVLFKTHYQLDCLYVNGDIVILSSTCCKQAFFYNLKDKTIVKIKSKSKDAIHWFPDSKDHVESLVSVH